MRYFFDMDGVLAVYPKDKQWWTVPGIFKRLKPQLEVIKAARQLIENGEDVYILSAYNRECPGVVQEKNEWLDQHFPEIEREKRIFMHVGTKKTDYVPNGITPLDVLLDDYNENLITWEDAGGIGVKLLNGINSGLTWGGKKAMAKEQAKQIVKILTEASYCF